MKKSSLVLKAVQVNHIQHKKTIFQMKDMIMIMALTKNVLPVLSQNKLQIKGKAQNHSHVIENLHQNVDSMKKTGQEKKDEVLVNVATIWDMTQMKQAIGNSM
jgi:hypothetical protein